MRGHCQVWPDRRRVPRTLVRTSEANFHSVIENPHWQIKSGVPGPLRSTLVIRVQINQYLNLTLRKEKEREPLQSLVACSPRLGWLFNGNFDLLYRVVYILAFSATFRNFSIIFADDATFFKIIAIKFSPRSRLHKEFTL